MAVPMRTGPGKAGYVVGTVMLLLGLV
ncbi:MAG: hypothetical protein JWM05_1407, partial [Acidimicrobiales bacterium]|nr:hypothetical protein [Acidimicrobiales bacterium]